MSRSLKVAALLSLLGSLSACKNESLVGDSDAKQGNSPPVADAGSDVTQTADFPVLLNGGGSFDPEGSALSYAWLLDSAPASSALPVNDPSLLGSAVDPSFSADVEGTYVASLVVTDAEGLSSTPAYVVITVIAGQAPVANAGPDQLGREGDAVSLDGARSYDPTGRDLTYAWVLQAAPPSSALTGMTDPTAVSSSFTPDVGGIYVASLVVNNGVVASAPDTAIIRVSSADPQPPTALAGEDFSGEDCTALNLDGSGSFDPNGEPLIYQWSLQEKPVGSTATNASFADRSAERTTFYPDMAGEYLLSLAVNDGTTWSAPDLLIINATERVANTPPVVDAGLAQSVAGGDAECTASGYSYICGACDEQSFILGDSATVSDADGDPLTLRWQLVSGDGTIADPDELLTSVRLEGAAPITLGACEDNNYELQLSATDCTGATTSDIVTYTISCCGVAPATAR